MEELLTRQEFKEQVFKRTSGKCCVPGCTKEAVDAHHILDRGLWKDGGYYLSNGAALCSSHHLEAEHGNITPLDCMEYMGISVDDIRLPGKLADVFSGPEEYKEAMKLGIIDKWGK
ncbi:MAG: hypothetical protein J6I84_04525 [Bacilli bacterium]|nr:hypothetical protein [Bacilli bacterium]